MSFPYCNIGLQTGFPDNKLNYLLSIIKYTFYTAILSGHSGWAVQCVERRSFRMSIKRKLTLTTMSISLVAVVLTVTAITAYLIYDMRKSKIQSLEVTAAITGDRNSAALAFLDADRVRSNLEIFRLSPSVLATCIYDAHDNLFADYKTAEVHAECPKVRQGARQALPGMLTAFTNIRQNGTVVGSVYIIADTREIDAYVQNIMQISGTVTLLVLAIAFVLTVYFQRAISGPILEFAATVQSITNSRNYTLRAKSGYLDETGVLANAFNKMLGEVQLRDRELLSANETLEEKVVVRTRQLEDAKQKAESANEAKSAFLANMSHEIRTPLNSMIGLTELILETDMTSQQEQHMRTVLQSSEVLLELINDMLDFSKIESGKLELDCIVFDLQTAIEDTAELFAPKVREKEQQLELLVDFAPNLPRHVMGDPTRMRQILSNMLNNAIKFTHEGYVLVKAEEIQDASVPADSVQVKISVHDTGIGIPADKLQVIFDKFTQADVSTTRKFGGTGLGLSICKQLANMMGGDVTVESTPGEGSTFSATMLLKRDTKNDNDPAVPDRQVLKGKRALIIDDVEPSRRILESYLSNAGIEVSGTGHAQMALWMLADAKKTGRPFDLVLTDYVLPEITSETFPQTIKMLHPDIPVVMVTAMAESGYAQIFASAECDAYFVKPVRPSYLLDTLAIIIEAKHAGKSLSMLTPFTLFRKGAAAANDDNSFLENAEILLVEDNRANRELCIKLLENFHCHPTAVRNGEEAIAIVRKQPFDLILMDCQMPEMDGFEASTNICRMKKQREISNIPIIALTANAMQGDREKCLESGMNDYVTKPLRKAALRSVLMQWLPPKGNRLTSQAAIH